MQLATTCLPNPNYRLSKFEKIEYETVWSPLLKASGIIKIGSPSDMRSLLNTYHFSISKCKGLLSIKNFKLEWYSLF